MKALILFLIIVSSLGLCQDKSMDFHELKSLNSIAESQTIKENFWSLGFLAGSHSSNLTLKGKDLSRGFIWELFLKYKFSEEVNAIIAFTYWNSRVKEIKTPVVHIPSEYIDSKGLKLGLDFSLLKISIVSLTIGPSVSVENINTAESGFFSFGANAKTVISLWSDKLNLMSAISYQNGAEAFDFGGGGINYSFFSYSLGLEAVIGN